MECISELIDMLVEGRGFVLFACKDDVRTHFLEAISSCDTEIRVHKLGGEPIDLDLSRPNLIMGSANEARGSSLPYLHSTICTACSCGTPRIGFAVSDRLDEWAGTNAWLKEENHPDEDVVLLDGIIRALRWDHPIVPRLSTQSTVMPSMILTFIEERLKQEMDRNGVTYQPQARIGSIHVDFLILEGESRLVVECDGAAFHSTEEAISRDARRDQFLREKGYSVLRFSGRQIIQDTDLCVRKIKDELTTVAREPRALWRSVPMDSNLDESQLEAVTAQLNYPVRVLAPAGSGKTKVLTNRFLHLVNQGIPPERILALAFNKDACKEMRIRLESFGLGSALLKKQVRTFHSYGLSIIKEANLYHPDNRDAPFFQDEKKCVTRFLDLLQQDRQIKLKRTRTLPAAIKESLQRTKGDLVRPGSVLFAKLRADQPNSVNLPNEFDPLWLSAFESLLEWQLAQEAWTFSDQVYYAVRLLSEDHTKRFQYQTAHDVILVDEYQDLNAAQHALLSAISAGRDHIFCVGDDDQMIYGWRGATVDPILEFSSRHAQSASLALSINYRSSRSIVRHSGYLISRNKKRVEKNQRARDGATEGVLKLCIGQTERDECKAAVEFLVEKRAQGSDWKDLAVLCRYREHFALVVEALRSESIPFICDRATLFSRKGAKTMAAYLEAVLTWPNPSGEAWRNIINYPNRYVRTSDVDRICTSPDPTDSLRHLPLPQHSSTNHVKDLLERLEGIANQLISEPMTSTELLEHIDSSFGVTTHFSNRRSSSDDNDEADQALSIELMKLEARDVSNPGDFLEICKKRALEEQEDGEGGEGTDGVRIDTIHKAKGKEWVSVVLFHQEWRQSQSKEAALLLEEERRVSYVGVTRAKENLLVTCTRGKMSRFVSELMLPLRTEDNDDPRNALAAVQSRLRVLEPEITSLHRQRTALERIADRGARLDRLSLQAARAEILSGLSLIRRVFLRIGFPHKKLAEIESQLKTEARSAEALTKLVELNASLAPLEIDQAEKIEELRYLRSEAELHQFLRVGQGAYTVAGDDTSSESSRHDFVQF